MNKPKPLQFPFPERKFIRTSKMIELGYSYYMIHRFVKDGIISRINGNTFENLQYTMDENEFMYVDGYVEQGVVCLMSAAVYHGMSTFRPYQIDVAIPSKSKVSILPDWPSIGIFYFSDSRHQLGIERISFEGGSCAIYDKEKTVCDLLTYRNKYGHEDCLAVLKNYLREEDRDINKLIRYAQQLRLYGILSKYLEVLL
ncbi:MAG: type IV toxin-antitoxin system AbiEi family antitoxin domain-containing protein [Sphaerochaeta sp.]|nr:type IV toxin-antitoxin system AbiEi family antitoxin domain-containing protein [Sphaerochaeta sp.]